MADNSGYLRLYRSMKTWEWYNDANTKIVFLHLLLNANWEESRFKGYDIPKGGLVIGLYSLSETLGISVQSVRTALDHLKSTNEITIKSTNRFSIVTIVNWEKYQGGFEEVTNKSTSKTTNKQQTTNKQLTTEEEYKNIENKNINSSKNIQEVVDLYHKNCPSLPQVTKITDARKKLINARLKDYSIEELEKAYTMAEESDFLTGRNGKWGGANFDWVMNTNNIVKILEGNYKNKETPKNDFKNFTQSNYDWDEINRELGIK